jgi:hypothetical protein
MVSAKDWVRFPTINLKKIKKKVLTNKTLDAIIKTVKEHKKRRLKK